VPTTLLRLGRSSAALLSQKDAQQAAQLARDLGFTKRKAAPSTHRWLPLRCRCAAQWQDAGRTPAAAGLPQQLRHCGGLAGQLQQQLRLLVLLQRPASHLCLLAGLPSLRGCRQPAASLQRPPRSHQTWRAEE
jgi:hypothetical protein